MNDAPPLQLHVNPDATAVAIHRPVPVPLHWQEQVKAELDRDVRLGVLEPVPIGEPTTWSSRMVVCPKKDGSPRRTVDLQRLNMAARYGSLRPYSAPGLETPKPYDPERKTLNPKPFDPESKP